MGEQADNNHFSSSQESLPLSQDTFQYLKTLLLDGTFQFDVEQNCNTVASANPDCSIIESGVKVTLDQVGLSVQDIKVPELTQNINIPHQQASLPVSNNWPGTYEFKVSFENLSPSTRAPNWTYSELKDKLYVKKDVACPISFSTNALLGENVFIRATALFSMTEHKGDVVHRCPNHHAIDTARGIPEAAHLVRCDSSSAHYEINDAGRYSVVVPFLNPAMGHNASTYIFKFACFGSCVGGPNRRPLMIVFTLERGTEVIGRRKTDVKICACPWRDRKTEEKETEISFTKLPAKRKDPSCSNLADVFEFTRQIMFPPTKKVKPNVGIDGYYNIAVKEHGCYKFLLQMKKFYDLGMIMKGTPHDFMRKIGFLFNETMDECEEQQHGRTSTDSED